MKRITLLILTVIFIFSCQTKYTPRNIEKINIEEFKIDSINSRAIYAISADKMYYAGANGDLGFTNMVEFLGIRNTFDIKILSFPILEVLRVMERIFLC